MTLEALEAQSLDDEDVEVLVVDDASTDETAQIAAAHAWATLLRQETPQGSYAARNRALRELSGAYVAITDAGCLPAPDWLERGLARLDEGDAVLAGRILMPLEPDAPLAAMVDVVHHLDQRRYVEDQGCAVTANLLTTHEVVRRVGPFDERLLSSGDFEWTTRARRAGVPLVYASDVMVVHLPRISARELLRKSIRVARGASAARAQGTASPNASRPYLHPKTVLLPRHRTRGRARVAENGGRPSPMRWLAVGAMQIALIQLPQALAALVFDLRNLLSRQNTPPLSRARDPQSRNES